MVTDRDEKIEALRAICQRFLPKHMDAFDDAIARSLERTAVVKITLTEPRLALWVLIISFHSLPFHFFALLVILLTLAGGRLSESYLYYSCSFQAAGDGIIEGIHVLG